MSFLFYKYQTCTSVSITHLRDLIKCLYFADFQIWFFLICSFISPILKSQIYYYRVLWMSLLWAGDLFFSLSVLEITFYSVYFENLYLYQYCFLILSYRCWELSFWIFILKFVIVFLAVLENCENWAWFFYIFFSNSFRIIFQRAPIIILQAFLSFYFIVFYLFLYSSWYIFCNLFNLLVKHPYA